jgi:hypothetical protein
MPSKPKPSISTRKHDPFRRRICGGTGIEATVGWLARSEDEVRAVGQALHLLAQARSDLLPIEDKGTNARGPSRGRRLRDLAVALRELRAAVQSADETLRAVERAKTTLLEPACVRWRASVLGARTEIERTADEVDGELRGRWISPPRDRRGRARSPAIERTVVRWLRDAGLSAERVVAAIGNELSAYRVAAEDLPDRKRRAYPGQEGLPDMRRVVRGLGRRRQDPSILAAAEQAVQRHRAAIVSSLPPPPACVDCGAADVDDCACE